MAGPRYFLVVRAPNGDVREVALESAIVIGRDESADVRVQDKKVSRRHAAFKLIDGKPFVEDLGSSNGVRLDGARIERRARVDARSEVRVGGYLITLRATELADADPTSALALDALPGASEGTGPMVRSLPRAGSAQRSGVGPGVVLVGIEAPVAGKRFRLRVGENVIGRLDECDVSVLHASVSRQHARVVIEPGGAAEVHDLGSANGIFVEGRRAEVAELADGDTLRIGEVAFRVELPPGARSPARPAAARVAGPRSGASWKWMVLGTAGLLVAASVLVLAVVWQRTPEMRRAARSFAARFSGSGADEGGATDPRRPGSASPAGAEKTAAKGDEKTAAKGDEKTAAKGAERTAAKGDEKTAAKGDEQTAAKGAEGARAEGAGGSLPSKRTDGRPFGQVRTATAPWSPRGPDGLPVRMPEVDPDFDHPGYVKARLEEARRALEEGAREEARVALEALLEVDPIQTEGRALQARLAELAAADEALARADALVAAGRLARAYRILSEVPLDLPQAEAARARAAELRERAVADARERALALAGERGRPSAWLEAHELFRLALELEPENASALEGLRELERKMRRRKMAFEAWRPERGGSSEDPTPKAAPPSPALDAYLRGDLKAAVRAARRGSRRAKGEKRARLRGILRGIEQVEGRFSRIRTEIPNDPSRAWAMLLELEVIEQGFVPSGARSYLVEELRADLSDAFAKQGSALFDTERYEAAFQRWEAGYKLDPTNPRVVAGLARLESVAERIAEEARVAARRGANADACERFRRVTKLTRATTELHQEARKQAFRICP